MVDDDALLREAVELELTQEGYQVLQHAGGQAFLEAQGSLQPGCVLLDINMPEVGGLEVLDALAERQIDWPVVVLTAQDQLRIAVEAMKRGAIEFLQKPIEAPALLSAMAEATTKLAERARTTAQLEQARARIASLSPREHEVLRGLLAGMTNKAMAYELGLSTRTVEIYRGNLMDKLDAASLSTVVRLALDAGVAPLDPQRT